MSDPELSPPDPASEDSTPDIEFSLAPDDAGSRLDVAITKTQPQFSRNFIRHLLNDGAILINGKSAKPSYKVRGGERVSIEVPEPEIIEARPEDIPLNILYEDSDIIAINKPPGMVAHPSSGHTSGSLVNGLLFHCKDLSSINGRLRPGIVHRLDKDTSGVIVAAKNDAAHRGLAEQFSGRTVCKEYVAIAYGKPQKDKFFNDGRIGRHPIRRTEMAVLRGPDEGREAYTDFEVLERFPKADAFLVRAMPKTGRTHQIRVHLARLGHPILCDELYGRESARPDLSLSRHALHAQRLTIEHPIMRKSLTFEAPIPDDMNTALAALRGS
ncbi:MAG TPA: RluA family pseudouridine synthase [Planctomycetota bacterium]|nr:RluA family pseudouridine synthase [Planctomycetota bacterium]